MRVLVTGGTGVVGAGLIPELLTVGHTVRLLARAATAAVRQWPPEVESFPADVTEPDQLRGAVADCDAIIHITGVVDEAPPDVTYQRVNIDGTRHVLDEAMRAGQPTVVYISSLAAERGASPYHASKRAAEALVRAYPGRWVVLRPGNVYGPGDQVISSLLGMQRTLPAIPVVGDGQHPFQPIWHVDLGVAITRALDDGVASGVYELSGEDVTTQHDLLDRFAQLTGRSPLRVPVPEFLAGWSTRIAKAAGVSLPINESQLQMILEHNVIEPPERNAIQRVFGVTPTSLSKGLALLADAQPEQEPGEGVGGIERKEFRADISGSHFTPEGLLEEFRQRCSELMPIEFEAEPGATHEVVKGATLTASIPLRGNIQIRVEDVQSRAITFATLRGHPLAGVVRFSTSDQADSKVRFAVTVFARAATVFDWVALNTVGRPAQNSNWRTVVERVVAVSGGSAIDGVEEEREMLDAGDSERVEEWIAELIAARKRALSAEGGQPAEAEAKAGGQRV